MRIRIRKTRYKLIYIGVYLALQYTLVLTPIPTSVLPTSARLIFDLCFGTFVYLFGARSFRGPGEDIAAPRAWWRMTNRPRAGFWISGLQLFGCAVAGYNLGAETQTGILPIVGLVVGVLLAALYFNSSIRLVVARRAVPAPESSEVPAPAEVTGDIQAVPDITPVRPNHGTGILLACLGGAAVIALIAVAVGVVVPRLGVIGKIISEPQEQGQGQYQTINAHSPLFTSESHAFSIRFPGTPSTKTFANGDIDVTYRTGKSDYSIIAGTLKPPAPSDGVYPSSGQWPSIYNGVISNLESQEKVTVLSKHAVSVKGLPAEQAHLEHGSILQPWEYTIIGCSSHIYQLNTYGLTPADSQKFVDSFISFGNESGLCG